MSERKSTPPWRSKLVPFRDEILEAWFKKRFTLKMIQAELKTRGVDISLSALSHFIRCRVNRADPHIAPTVSKKRLASRKNAETSSLDDLLEKSLDEIKQEWLNDTKGSGKK